MKIILNKKKLRKLIAIDTNLGFVPTMGGIHKGHISLCKRSKKECDKTVVSIFVNKTQFNQKSDYKKYPRMIKKDINLLKKIKIDYLFIPTDKQIFQSKEKKIKMNPFGKALCGKYRPGHFEGVLNVINRLIKIIEPKKIYLGEKDLQQLILIKDFVKKKFDYIKVVSCKTIREKNGLAMSTRNNLLTAKNKENASKLYNFIKKNKKKIVFNKKFRISIRKKLNTLGINNLEYIKVIDINKILKPYIKKTNFKVFIAYYLNKVRLIDNI